MSRNKWTVSRIWDGVWRVWDGDGHFQGSSLTWEAAMRHADRAARTITVTLPRLAPTEWTAAGNFRVTPEPPEWGDALEVDELDDDGAYFIIGKEDCEPLALALLAHARRMA